MFWDRSKYKDKKFGDLVFKSGYWVQVDSNNSDELFIEIQGTKKGPSNIGLAQMKSILSQLINLESMSKKFIESKDIQSEFEQGIPLVLESISSTSAEGTFDLGFGVSNDSLGIIVHFKNSEPYEISMVH